MVIQKVVLKHIFLGPMATGAHSNGLGWVIRCLSIILQKQKKLHEFWCSWCENHCKHSVWGLTLFPTSFRGCKIKWEFCKEVGGLRRCSVQPGEAEQGTKTRDTINWSEGSLHRSHQGPSKGKQGDCCAHSSWVLPSGQRCLHSMDPSQGRPDDPTPHGFFRTFPSFHPYYPAPFPALVIS